MDVNNNAESDDEGDDDDDEEDCEEDLEEDIEDEMSEQEDFNLEDLQKNDLPDNNTTPATINYINSEVKPVSHYINYALLNDSNWEKNNIQALITKKVNAFVTEQS